MHVMTKYLDTKKAAIAALQDYTLMEQIIDTTDDSIKEAYADASSPASPRMDGTTLSLHVHTVRLPSLPAYGRNGVRRLTT
ncbi:hypothetical protein [Arcanobacterium phocae]|uniref:hypothetical protein n=1 Tax=Arcanobacterium phocae TaxID=131112 RepID=UPI001C0EB642|nr:hypothetical protein [Arcanobacterium phocae]